MSLFQRVFKLCPPSLKKKFWWLLSGMLLLAIGETVTVGLLAFYAAAVSDPQSTWQAVERGSQNIGTLPASDIGRRRFELQLLSNVPMNFRNAPSK